MLQVNAEAKRLLFTDKELINKAAKAIINSSQEYTGGKGNEQYQKC